MSTTRLALRRYVGRLTRQALICTATGNGTTQTFTDAINLPDPDDTLIGRIGWVSGGTAGNLYSTIRVTDNVQSTNTITFTPALSQSTATGDVIELWNDLDQGVTPAEVHDLINLAIESVADSFPIPAVDTEEVFSQDDPELDIPATWRWLEGLEYQEYSADPDVEGKWKFIWDDKFLYVDKANRVVRVKKPWCYKLNTLNVRLRGATRPSTLSSDTATTYVDAEWIARQVAYQILLNISFTMLDGAALERRAATFKQEADAIRMKARARPDGLGIVLPL